MSNNDGVGAGRFARDGGNNNNDRRGGGGGGGGGGRNGGGGTSFFLCSGLFGSAYNKSLLAVQLSCAAVLVYDDYICLTALTLRRHYRLLTMQM
jgi:hypothetical protein